MEKRKLLKRIVLLTGGYLLLVGAFYALQSFYIFQPEPLKSDYEYVFDGPFEEHSLEVESDVQLNLLRFPAQGKREGAVLYFHGNSDNLQRWGQYHTDFTKRGYDVWMYDYRGYGKSDGEPGDQIFYQDAKKVFDWVQEQYPDEELVLFGRSLGTSIASELATRVRCDSLVLESPFNNLADMFKMKYPWLWQPFGMKYNFANDRHLELGISAPVYVIHGTRDFVVPYECSLHLKLLMNAKDKLVLIDGGGHKNLSEFSSYQRTLNEILGRRI